jgi:1-deoxy-D-xylulose-5-phosphate synthase
MGGAGSAVLEYLSAQSIATPCQLMGIPDRYVEHASPAEQIIDIGIDKESIIAKVMSYL